MKKKCISIMVAFFVSLFIAFVLIEYEEYKLYNQVLNLYELNYEEVDYIEVGTNRYSSKQDIKIICEIINNIDVYRQKGSKSVGENTIVQIGMHEKKYMFYVGDNQSIFVPECFYFIPVDAQYVRELILYAE